MLGEGHARRVVILLGDDDHVEFGAVFADHILHASEALAAKGALRVVEDHAGVVGRFGLQIHEPLAETGLGQFLAYNDVLGRGRDDGREHYDQRED